MKKRRGATQQSGGAKRHTVQEAPPGGQARAAAEDITDTTETGLNSPESLRATARQLMYIGLGRRPPYPPWPGEDE